MSYIFNTKDMLKDAGWYEGRKIDISAIERHYKEYGFEVFPEVKKFLEEFGMLEILVEYKNGKKQVHSTNPLKVVGDYFCHGKFSAEEYYAGERLVPVGQCCDGNLLLYVSELGKIYHDTGKCGDTFWEGWECLINKQGLVDWGTLQKERHEEG